MKLERLPEYVLPVVVTMMGMGMAVVLGYFMGQGRLSTVLLIAAALALGTLTLALRQYVWLLIPFGWPLTGTVPLLPLPFAVRDLTIMAAFVAFLMLVALKVIRRKPKYGFADYLLFALLIYLAIAFLRNPVGTSTTNSVRIGGRPYFNVAIACMAYWILCRATLAPRLGTIPIWVALASNYLAGALSAISQLVPRTLPFLSQLYSGVVGVEALNAVPGTFQPEEDPARKRLIYLEQIGTFTIQGLLAFCRPSTLINPLYFGRFLCLLAASFLQLLSGFRSSILTTLGWTALAAWLRDGFQSVVRLALVGGFVLILVILGQGRIFNLPFPAQRALSFLPGLWDPMAVADAKSSTEWRVEMWNQYLKSNKYVHNHFLGDGFGFLKRDLDMANSPLLRGPSEYQETAMIVGNVHNGPLSAIKVVGYVGLVAYLLLFAVVARLAWKTIHRAQGTQFLPVALFMGLPTIFHPFAFIVIFGAFEHDFPTTIFNLGMLKVLNRSLDEYQPKEELEESSDSVVWRSRRGHEEALNA